MRNNSFNIKLVRGVEKRDSNKTIPGTWSKHTNQNIKESQGMLILPFHIDHDFPMYFCIER
jgi:hypothetical protein